MSDYRKMKVTNLRTGEVYGYLGTSVVYLGIVSAPEHAGEITWAMKESDLDGKGGIAQPGFQPGVKTPTTAEEWARVGYAYLAIKNTKWDIHGEQLWLSDDRLNAWARWSWTSSYTRVHWLPDNTITAEPDEQLVLYMDVCTDTGGGRYLRWGKPTNPSVVRLDFV